MVTTLLRDPHPRSSALTTCIWDATALGLQILNRVDLELILFYTSVVPNVGFELESYTATEGSSQELMVTVVSDEPVAAGVVEVDVISLTAEGEGPVSD